MCLSEAYEIYDGKDETLYAGYKGFMFVYDCDRDGSKVRFQPLYMVRYHFDYLPFNEWLDEKDYRPEDAPDWLLVNETGLVDVDTPNKYPVGWHVYMTYPPTSEDFPLVSTLAIKEVQCKGLLAKGVEGNKQVWVFKFIKILEE